VNAIFSNIGAGFFFAGFFAFATRNLTTVR
jgi:hypothetical protein